ncbi:MAG: ABC transporter substrate-binding protein [Propionibacteriaceae bacterium]|nr:ABC transporter substrate-binding protein [Propionibacteriaceae bacterium]
MKRRIFLGAAGAFGLSALAACGGGGAQQAPATSGSPSASDAAGALTFTDVAGRTVTLDQAPSRVVLGESRHAYSLLFLQRDNLLDKVVAWGSDMQKAAPDVYQRLEKVKPEAADLPVIGSAAKGDLSVETLLEHKADLFLMTLDQYEAAQQEGFDAKLEAAKIPFAVTDFRRKPVDNTHASVELLGKVFGVSDRAAEFLAHYDSLVKPVITAAQQRAEAERPLTYVWRSAGISEPGRTFGDSNFGQIVAASGGVNLGTTLLPGHEGTITTEQLIASQPKLIIATGGDWEQQQRSEKATTSYVKLGYNATSEQVNESLAQLVNETGYSELTAFTDKQIFGIYHQFYDAPFNFLAYLAFAQWQGLEVAGAPSVDEAWRDFHTKFMPFEAEGVFAAKLS